MTKNPYEQLGGESIVRALVERFYEIMDTEPEVYGIRKLHPSDLTSSKEKLYKFLSGWLGGPPLYTNEYGHPRLRARHLPFPIGETERDQWMYCMRKAMSEIVQDAKLREFLEQSLFRTADFMRNQGAVMSSNKINE